MDITQATEALRSTISTVQADIHEIAESGEYYCTDEIARELAAIRNALEHVRLDGNLLHSQEWQQSFNPRSTASSLAGATSVLDMTAARLFDYKCQLRAVPLSQKQDNEVKEMHQWAITTLKQIQEDLKPFAYGATDRIKQFGDHVGVTDRYTGYRNNLTRSSHQPVELDTAWMDKGQTTGFMNPVSKSPSSFGFESKKPGTPRPTLLKSRWGGVEPDNLGSLEREVRYSNDRAPMSIYRGYRTIDSLYPRSTTLTAPGVRAGGEPNFSEHVDKTRFLNTINDSLMDQSSNNRDTAPVYYDGMKNRSPQERAGINLVFPGKSEYMRRYLQPFDISRCSDFLINPQPDMGIHGRPLGQARFDPNSTEYQKRYEWPDGEKIHTRPWMRK